MNATSDICPNCNDHLEGDGFHTIFHCPNAKWEKYAFNEPDSEPVYCMSEEEFYETRVGEMAKKGRKVAELLGTTLHSFDPGYTFGNTGHLPEHVVNYIYKQHIELMKWIKLSVSKN